MGAFAIPQQASTITSAPATTSAPSNLTPQQSCAIACDPSDLACRAACVGVARPNASQAVETTECAARCDQGNGSPADTQKYSDCVQSCISSLFPSSQTVSLANGAAGSNSNTNAASATGSGGKLTKSLCRIKPRTFLMHCSHWKLGCYRHCFCYWLQPSVYWRWQLQLCPLCRCWTRWTPGSLCFLKSSLHVGRFGSCDALIKEGLSAS